MSHQTALSAVTSISQTIASDAHDPNPENELAVARLVAIMSKLRDPNHGCPWDVQQTFKTIAPYTIEEAYEVADAIERCDMVDLKEELGDLLLQVVFHAQMAAEQNLFTFYDVVHTLSQKLIRRHPYVFAGETLNEEERSARWEEIKQAEKAAKQSLNSANAQISAPPRLFDGIPVGFPALLRSAKLQKRAKGIGFDWPSTLPILAKLEEELLELKAEIENTGAQNPEVMKQRQTEEFGDLMFVLVNLGLHLDIDAEAALRSANNKFARRIHAMQDLAEADNASLEKLSLEEQEILWQRVKATEKSPASAPNHETSLR